jgi:hypothetical protein
VISFQPFGSKMGVARGVAVGAVLGPTLGVAAAGAVGLTVEVGEGGSEGEAGALPDAAAVGPAGADWDAEGDDALGEGDAGVAAQAANSSATMAIRYERICSIPTLLAHQCDSCQVG